MTEFSGISGKTDALGTTKTIRETRNTDQRHENDRPKHSHTEENLTTVSELVSPLTQKGQKQTQR